MNRITAGAIALVSAILLAGCAQQRLAAQCRWVTSGDDLVRYGGCGPAIYGEYIVSLGMDTEVNIITEIYGRYGIKYIKEVQTTLQGKQYVRLYWVALTDDPGFQKMFELASKATGWTHPYVNVTPNYMHQP